METEWKSLLTQAFSSSFLSNKGVPHPLSTGPVPVSVVPVPVVTLVLVPVPAGALVVPASEVPAPVPVASELETALFVVLGAGASVFVTFRVVAARARDMFDAVDAMDDMDAVDASDDDESDFFSFFLLPPTSLDSMSRSISSVTGFFRTTDLWRISGWFQIWNKKIKINLTCANTYSRLHLASTPVTLKY